MAKVTKVQMTPYVPEVDVVRKIYEQAEKQILEALTYKRGAGLVDYAESAALQRVEQILQSMVTESWQYVPSMVQKQYLVGKKHTAGYANAQVMTIPDTTIVERLVNNLMMDITQAANTTNTIIKKTWSESMRIARLNADTFRSSILTAVAQSEATGVGVSQAQAIFLKQMKEQGITAFVDARGNNWSLRSYAEMATRTTSRQATNLGVLMADPEHDLYRVSSHGTTCKLCAPFEGRVYSRSGTSPFYPPLTLAFGKIDARGSDTLDNSYLNIHPNCLHVLTKFYEQGRTEEELKRLREFSDPKTNPIDVDPRTKAQQEAYRLKETARTKLLNDYKQFERYRMTMPDDMPKTFQTFLKHKTSGSQKYQDWQALYRQTNRELKNITLKN